MVTTLSYRFWREAAKMIHRRSGIISMNFRNSQTSQHGISKIYMTKIS